MKLQIKKQIIEKESSNLELLKWSSRHILKSEISLSLNLSFNKVK